MHTPDEIAAKLLAVPYEALDERAKKVARHIAARTHIARNVAKEFEAQPTPGQQAADAVASFGGSWTFVGLFAAAMLLWVGLNAYLLMLHGKTFDPYPYILLNLFLSMLAAIQVGGVKAIVANHPSTHHSDVTESAVRKGPNFR